MYWWLTLNSLTRDKPATLGFQIELECLFVCFFWWRGENRSTWRKITVTLGVRCLSTNPRIPHMTHGRNRTWATLVGGKHSLHCAGGDYSREVLILFFPDLGQTVNYFCNILHLHINNNITWVSTYKAVCMYSSIIVSIQFSSSTLILNYRRTEGEGRLLEKGCLFKDLWCNMTVSKWFDLQGRAVQTALSLEEGLKQVVHLNFIDQIRPEYHDRLVHLAGSLQTDKVRLGFEKFKV